MRAPLVATALALALVSAEAVAGPIAEDAYDTTGDAKKIAWMDRGMDAVRLKLRDPDSAEFRGVYFSRAMGAPLTCGQVNAKNALGGYTGFQRFVSGGRLDLTYLEDEVSDFENLWAKAC